MESNNRKSLALVTQIVATSILLGYGMGWAMTFPIIICILLILSVFALFTRIEKQETYRRKGSLLLVAAIAFSAFSFQKLGEYLMYKYARDAEISSYEMPLWVGAVSANAPSIWEKAILDKVEKVKEGKSFFASDKDKTGYSVGPDGSDQGGLILYDPTNGVLSPGDIPLKSGTGAFVPKS